MYKFKKLKKKMRIKTKYFTIKKTLNIIRDKKRN